MKKGLVLLSIIAGSLLLVGCSSEEKSPVITDISTSQAGADDIKKNGVPKPSGQTIDVNK